MANYTVNISQAVANQEEALKLNSTTPDTLGSIFSSFFVIHSQLTNAYSYAPTYRPMALRKLMQEQRRRSTPAQRILMARRWRVLLFCIFQAL